MILTRTRGVWGLANVFANGKLYFTRDVPEANYLPQGLEPPAKPAAKPAPKAAKPRTKPSKPAAKPAAKVAAKPAAKPAAGEPIPVAPVEHVLLFKVKYSCQKTCQVLVSWHTEPGGGGVPPNNQTECHTGGYLLPRFAVPLECHAVLPRPAVNAPPPARHRRPRHDPHRRAGGGPGPGQRPGPRGGHFSAPHCIALAVPDFDERGRGASKAPNISRLLDGKSENPVSADRACSQD